MCEPDHLSGGIRFSSIMDETIVNDLIKVEETFLGGPKQCRMCESALPRDAHFCERCGFQVQRGPSDPVDVRTRDVVLSVIMACMALAATLIPTYPFASAAFLSGINPRAVPELIVIGMWNVLVLGCPILFVFRRWYTRVRRGEFHHAWVWRDYWFLQAMALTPVWFFAAVFGVAWLVRKGIG